MRRAFMLAAVISLLSVTPALACKECNWHYVWPQLDECPFCDDSYCGYVLCHIKQGNDPNDPDGCVFDGEGCNDKGDGMCGPPSVGRLDDTWRLKRVTLVTKAAQKPASVRLGKKG